MGVSVKSGYIYRIRSRTSPNLLLELSNGSSINGTPAQGWSPINNNENFFNQIWLLTKISGTQSWTFLEIRSGTYLDLDHGGTKDGTKIQGYQGPGEGKSNLAQEWSLSAVTGGGYKAGHLAVDLSNGGKGNGYVASVCLVFVQNYGPAHKNEHSTPVWGYHPIDGNTNQIWDFEQWSYTATDIQSSIKSMPLASGFDVVAYTFPADKNYLVLPYTLYNVIWLGSMQGYKWRRELFDCDDFAFVYKAAVASYGYKWLGQVKLDDNKVW
ncbi:hypothetical protein VTI74DRAFT_877 [Chaetomium olivicolor]